MYKGFKATYSAVSMSYELYRKQVSEMNISYSNQGHKECFDYEKFNLYVHNSSHTNINLNCDNRANWSAHKNKYDAARTEYKNDGN